MLKEQITSAAPVISPQNGFFLVYTALGFGDRCGSVPPSYPGAGRGIATAGKWDAHELGAALTLQLEVTLTISAHNPLAGERHRALQKAMGLRNVKAQEYLVNINISATVYPCGC